MFGNLSQIKDVRCFIVQHKGTFISIINTPYLSGSPLHNVVFAFSVHQFVVTLLDSKNPDVCFSACGVLINLSADSENRALLRVEGTTQK